MLYLNQFEAFIININYKMIKNLFKLSKGPRIFAFKTIYSFAEEKFLFEYHQAVLATEIIKIISSTPKDE
jgi:hypothetical protein